MHSEEPTPVQSSDTGESELFQFFSVIRFMFAAEGQHPPRKSARRKSISRGAEVVEMKEDDPEQESYSEGGEREEEEDELEEEELVDPSVMFVATGLFNFDALEQHQLPFRKNDALLVLPIAEADWWPAAKSSAVRGELVPGYVPRNYVALAEEEDYLEGLPDTVPQKKCKRAVCNYDFVASSKFQLSFSKGTVLKVCPLETSKWWFACNPSTGESGNVPKNFLDLHDENTLRHKSSLSNTLFETTLSLLGCERPSSVLTSSFVELVTFEDERTLVEEALELEAIYVIRNGGIKLLRKGKIVAVLEEGRWLGDQPFDEPTSLICRGNVQAYRIPKRIHHTVQKQIQWTTQLAHLHQLRSHLLRMDCILRMPAQIRSLAILRSKIIRLSLVDVQAIIRTASFYFAVLIENESKVTVIVDGGETNPWTPPRLEDDSGDVILVTMDRSSHEELIAYTAASVGTEEVDVYRRISLHPLFRKVPPQTLQHLSVHITLKSFSPAELITDVSHLYVVYSGYVTIDGGKESKQIYDFFGQLPFIDELSPNHHAIRAGTTGCTCFSIPTSTVGELLTQCPQVKNTLIASMPNYRTGSKQEDWICNPLASMIRLMAGTDNHHEERSEEENAEQKAALKVWNSIGEKMQTAHTLLTAKPQYFSFQLDEDARFANKTLPVDIFKAHADMVTLTARVDGTLADLIDDYAAKRGSLGPDRFVAKIRNRHVFFRYLDVPLFLYKHFREASILSNTQQPSIQLELVSEDPESPLPISFKKMMRTINASYSAAKTMYCVQREPEPTTEPEPEQKAEAGHLSPREVSWPVRVRLVDLSGLEGFADADTCEAFFVRLEIVSGGTVLDFQQSRSIAVPNNAGYIALEHEWIYFNQTIATLTPSVRICITLYAVSDATNEGSSPERVLAGSSFQLFDHTLSLRTGVQALSLWPSAEGEKVLFCSQNPSLDACLLRVQLDDFPRPVRHMLPSVQPFTPPPPDGNLSGAVEAILKKDPLEQYRISQHDRRMVWKERALALRRKGSATLVLYCADWSNPEEQHEALGILFGLRDLTAAQAMELLDRHHAHPSVREYAVERLESLDENALGEYLLQLVQVLKYEPYHNSALAAFLLRRAFRNPLEIGQKLFWSLIAEVHLPRTAQRFGLLLKSLYAWCGPLRVQLCKQFDQQTILKKVSEAMMGRRVGSKSERTRYCRKLLKEVNSQLPTFAPLCLDPTVTVGSLVVDKCKVMNSKKRPLWLAYEPYDLGSCGQKEPVLLMFKAGDDLRQDQMTLQLLRFMNRVWLESGLDLKLTPYKCVTTGYELGMLEIVKESETTANIQVKYGGKFGALQKNTLLEWLKENSTGAEGVAKARENFVRSCAGYCVATYVLGIGDRHSDNIMLSKHGRLFHIDFGHFLGHFKSKFGVKRERTSFVFTKEMAFVMGGKGDPQYQVFVKLCCQAYNCLRAHKTELVRLFSLMIPARMPELVDDRCIDYLTQKLCISMTDKLAADAFRKEINTCLADTYRRIDNFIHNWKVS